MTINIVSDLHCRTKSFPPSFDVQNMAPADALVIAGDLGTHVNYDRMLDKLNEATKDRFGTIVCIKGNHDYYVTDPYWLKRHSLPPGPSVTDNFVVRHTVNDETVDFICSTLWSPIEHDDTIRRYLNDYNFIHGFTTQRSTELFWANLEWLESAVKDSRAAKNKVVVVTHHLPLPELIEEQYKDSDINEAFCVLNKEGNDRLDAIRPDLWIHGHSHSFMDKTIDGVRYVRNAYGYEWTTHHYDTGSSKEETGYVKDFIVTV